jgi:hypothetical protein
MMTTIRLAVVPLALLMTADALGDSPRGIGILGDSFSDEYQFYPPDRSTARNWVEILATKRGLDFGRFDAGGRGEPCNQGYAFNWARSGATTEDLIRTDQHTGLAAQVARGEVGIVVIFIGGNDFINAVKGSDPTAGLAAALSRAQGSGVRGTPYGIVNGCALGRGHLHTVRLQAFGHGTDGPHEPRETAPAFQFNILSPEPLAGWRGDGDALKLRRRP